MTNLDNFNAVVAVKELDDLTYLSDTEDANVHVDNYLGHDENIMIDTHESNGEYALSLTLYDETLLSGKSYPTKKLAFISLANAIVFGSDARI